MGSVDQLSALDASFLYLETPRTPMHVGSVSVFEAGGLRDAAGRIRIDDLQDVVRERLALVPRFRKRVVAPPWRMGRPRWVDDETLDVRHHVRLVTLPPPGTERQLRELTAQLHMELLDRSRPLWEMWFVDGLADGRVACIEKMHHAMVDGVSGVDVATATMDLTPVVRHPDAPDWHPEHAPGFFALFGGALADAATGAMRGPLRRARNPVDAVRAAAAATRGLLAAPAAEALAPRCSLNQAVGHHRLLETASLPLADAKGVARAAGATLNDVLLACVASGIRRLLLERGDDVTGLRPNALVPVSLRADHEHLALGNRVSSMTVPLPVDIVDPATALATVAAATAHRKTRQQAAFPAAALSALDALPPIVWSPLTAVVHRQPLVNVVVTNVPGPPVPLYLLGSKLLETAPVVPLAGNLDVSVGILSYVDTVCFGLFADADVCADVGVLAEEIEKSFHDLKGDVT